MPSILLTELTIFYSKLSICWESLLLSVVIMAGTAVAIAAKIAGKVAAGATKNATRFAAVIASYL